MTNAYLQERIAKTKLLIEAYEAAALALGEAGTQSYRLDTGQSSQTVTKLDLPAITNTLDTLYNRLCVMEARLTGSGTKIGRPAW